MAGFPSWRYHATERARIVNSEAEDNALGPAWADSPAAFDVSEADKADAADLDVSDEAAVDDAPKRKRGKK